MTTNPNYSLDDFLDLTLIARKIYGEDSHIYIDYNDGVFVFFNDTYLDFHDDNTVINNDKVIFIGIKFDNSMKKLIKILRYKKLKRLIWKN